MDNNFEQQFIKDVTSAPATNKPAVTANTESNKDGLGLFKILAVIAMALNIVVVVMIGLLMNNVNNITSLANNSDSLEEKIEYEDPEADDDFDANFTFNDNGDLIAITTTCTKDDGATFKFYNDNTYTESGSSYTADSGTYSILRSEIITIVDTQNVSRVLYYNGIILADGETIYECE